MGTGFLYIRKIQGNVSGATVLTINLAGTFGMISEWTQLESGVWHQWNIMKHATYIYRLFNIIEAVGLGKDWGSKDKTWIKSFLFQCWTFCRPNHQECSPRLGCSWYSSVWILDCNKIVSNSPGSLCNMRFWENKWRDLTYMMPSWQSHTQETVALP